MAREMAVQMLYQSDLGGSTLPRSSTRSISRNIWRARPLPRTRSGGCPRLTSGRSTPAAGSGCRRHSSTPRLLVRGAFDHRERIDELIRSQADNWRLERMPPVDRNILRLAVYEMLHERDTPKLVVLDEAIELAKKFGSEQSGRFVNGLLDGLLKQHTFPGSLT